LFKYSRLYATRLYELFYLLQQKKRKTQVNSNIYIEELNNTRNM